MKILVLSHEYPPVGGGGGKIAQDLCKGFVDNGHDVCLLTSHFGDLPMEETIDGVELLRLNVGRDAMFKASMSSMMRYDWASFWTGWKKIRDWHPDVIHAHFAVPAGATAFLLSMLTGIPYVITAHLGDVPGGTPEKTSKWFKIIYPFTFPIWKRADKIVAVSQFTKSLADVHYAVPITIIHNGIDLSSFDGDSIQVNKVPHLVFAGRYMPQKNVPQIIRSLAKIKDLDWTCTLIGDGPEREQVDALIVEFGLEGRVHQPGWVKPEEVIAVFQDADILFMPSYSEGLPLTGLQALACSLAFMVSDIGGFADLVLPSENGFALDPDDTDGYTASLTALMVPETLLAAKKASWKHVQNFDLQLIIHQYEKVFESVLRE